MHGLHDISTIVFLFLIPTVFARTPTKRVDAGIHVPIQLNQVARNLVRRGGQTALVGTGDFKDITYSVALTIGGKNIPVVLDSGSADLWVLSDACTTCSAKGGSPHLYPQQSLKPSGLGVRLQYGDSRTGTHAYGPIGQDEVALLGLSFSNQYFAAINDTNTSVLDSGCSGIFGLGFPINSFIWHDVYVRTLDPMIYPTKRHFSPIMTRQIAGSAATNAILASLPSMGPLIPRLVMQNVLQSPMFAVSLQRDVVDVGGNAGLLSIGEFPPGTKSENFTWSNVRGYTVPQKGLPPPTDSPSETYPMAWEIPVDDVFFDGERLPPSTLPKTKISLTALIDTGNSLIRGPADVVAAIFSRLGSSQFDCSTPHTLAFQIGGRMFPVDPRDFITPVSPDSTDKCFANLVSTDTPVEGENYLYSWSLGAPFLKGVIAAFHYGNITYPSQDPPRIGFASTVPADAAQRLKAAIAQASRHGGRFPISSESAPSGMFASPPSPTSSGLSSTSSPLGRTNHTPQEGFANSAGSLESFYHPWTSYKLWLGLIGQFLIPLIL